MLGMYERRRFTGGEKVWLVRYRGLVNVLHWHFECEIIRVAKGGAQIRIGEKVFAAHAGDCFFCASEQMHYIIGDADSVIEVMIINGDVANDVTGTYSPLSPEIPPAVPVEAAFCDIRKELRERPAFYREAVQTRARGLIIDIFRACPTARRTDKKHLFNDLLARLSRDYAFITFADAVRFSGYSPSHFSKLFKKLSGMTFSEYMNVLKVENALLLLREDKAVTVTAVSLKCGFSTVRNFNRVFKRITGYSPRTLPAGFVIEAGFGITGTKDFDPTDKTSMLLD